MQDALKPHEVEPIFIVGLPRSGSTLWLNIFAQHPEICRIGEILFLTPWRKDFRYFLHKTVGDLASDESLEKMVGLMFSGQSIPGLEASFWYNEAVRDDGEELKRTLFKSLRDSDRSIPTILRALIEEYTLHCGYRRCCAKFPVYINWVPQLLEWFPKCKIVHITRDPRAMVVSRMSDPGGTQLKLESHPRLAWTIRGVMSLFVLVQYSWESFLYRKYQSLKNYRLFHFEDLLADPKSVICQLCEFTELPFHPNMLQPDAGQASSITGKRVSGFAPEVAFHWKKKMSPWADRLIRIMARGSMRRLGHAADKHPFLAGR